MTVTLFAAAATTATTAGGLLLLTPVSLPAVCLLAVAAAVGATAGVMDGLEKKDTHEENKEPIQQAVQATHKTQKRIEQTLKKEKEQTVEIKKQTATLRNGAPKLHESTRQVQQASTTLAAQTDRTQELLFEIERLRAQAVQSNKHIASLEQALRDKEGEFSQTMTKLMEDQKRHEKNIETHHHSSLELIQRSLRLQQYFQSNVNELIESKDLEIRKLKREISGLRATLRQIDKELNEAIIQESSAYLFKPIPQKQQLTSSALPGSQPPSSAQILQQHGQFKVPQKVPQGRQAEATQPSSVPLRVIAA